MVNSVEFVLITLRMDFLLEQEEEEWTGRGEDKIRGEVAFERVKDDEDGGARGEEEDEGELEVIDIDFFKVEREAVVEGLIFCCCFTIFSLNALGEVFCLLVII